MKSGDCTYVQGYGSGTAICFQAKVSGRAVGVVVPEDTIKRLMAILNHTNHVGHAVWHLNNPERELPCPDCRGKS